MTPRSDRFVVSMLDWQAVVDALHEGVGVLDADQRILHCNQAAIDTLGRPAEELMGRTLVELGFDAVREDGSPLTPEHYPTTITLREGTPVRDFVAGVPRPDGGLRWIALATTPLGREARPAALVVTFRDVTERRDYVAELQRLAEVDELTGLPNRRAFLATLSDHLASRRREDDRGTLLVLDLDRFKELNDTLGHAVGDRVLVHAARAMEERLRATDFLGRLAGDEFAVLLRGADAAEGERVARELAERLREEALPTAQGVGQVSASIGIVPLTGPAGASVDRALLAGDEAMYAAKSAGRDRWQLAHVEGPPERNGSAQIGVQLAKRSRQLALVNALGARLDGMTDVAAIAEATVEELHRAFGYHMCAVVRLREDDYVEALAVRGSPFLALAMRDWRQPRDHGVIGRCLRERAPVLVNDVHADRDYAVTPETVDVRSELVAPLLVGGSLWGAINLEELVEDAFDDEDAQLLSTLTNQVAAAIRSAQLAQRLAVASA